MDELATTVSDILNQASNGIGYLSAWLASDGLSGYAASMTAISASHVAMAAFVAIMSFTVAAFAVASDTSDKRILKNMKDDLAACMFGVSVTIFLLSIVFLAFSISDLAGWLASPDGMLLKTLVDGLTAK